MSLCCLADFGRLQQAARVRKLQVFRPGTVCNQLSHVRLFVAFALYFEVEAFPAQVEVLLMCGEFLTREYNACKSVTNCLSSLRTFHLQYSYTVDAFDHVSLNLRHPSFFTREDRPSVYAKHSFTLKSSYIKCFLSRFSIYRLSRYKTGS